MPLFKGTRKLVTYEDVIVEAKTPEEAKKLIEDDDLSVEIIKVLDYGYDILGYVDEYFSKPTRRKMN